MKNYSKIKKATLMVMLSMLLTACNSNQEAVSEVADEIDINDGVVENEIKYGELKNIFAPGEHVVSVPIEDVVYEENVQYEYHPGYKPVGMTCVGYGKSSMHNGGAAIVYVNTEEILAYATGINEKGGVVFTDFGVINGEDIKDNEEDNYSDVREFAEGEHIISIPYTVNVIESMVQFPSYPGYELIGMSGVSYGQSSSHFHGGALLFVNNETVECKLVIDEEENKSYSNMGTIVNTTELDTDTSDINNKTLSLNQE